MRLHAFHRGHERTLDHDHADRANADPDRERLARPRPSAMERAGAAWTPSISSAVQMFAAAINVGVR